MDSLITQISDPNRPFLTKTLGFTAIGEGKNVIDLENLVVMGHQLGGLTALSITASDKAKRIKAVVAIDPWFTPYHKEILHGHFKIKDSQKAVCIIESEGYAEEIDWKVLGLNSQKEDTDKFLADSANTSKQERVCVKMQGSVHQNDNVLFDPLRVSILYNGSLPFFNQAKLYLLNAQLAMRFLHRTGCVTSQTEVESND